METVLCTQHKAELDAGCDWQYDAEAHEILMGSDLLPLIEEARITHHAGDTPGILTFTCRTVDGPIEVPLRLPRSKERRIGKLIAGLDFWNEPK